MEQALFNENQFTGQTLEHLGLISATIEKIGLIEKVDARLPISKQMGAKTTMGQRVAAMILNGLGFIDDRLYMFPQFLDNKPVERLLGEGLKAENFNDDALGRCLDQIYDYGTTKFFSEVAFEIGVEHQLLGRSAHFDTTSLSVFGEYNSEENVVTSDATEGEDKTPINITYGYSKDHRKDLKQMVLDLATTGAAGFPIWMEAHSGNASDKKVLQESAQRMRKFCKGLKEAPEFLFVGDSAMYENCVKKAGDMKWLSRVPEKISEAKQWLIQKDEKFEWVFLENGYRITALDSNYGGVQQRWLLVSSEQAYARESKTLDKNIEQEKSEVGKMLWHLGNRSFECPEDAQNTANELVKKLKYHKVSFTVSSVEKYAGKGRPKKEAAMLTCGYKINGTLSKNEEKIEEVRRTKGRFILATNELDHNKLPDKEILPEYKAQSATENGFRFIKGNAFEVSSVFLKKASRIEALMVIMTLCLMVYSLSQYHLRKVLTAANETIPNQIKKPTNRPSMSWVCRLFQGVQLLHIRIGEVTQKIVINLSQITRRIISYFGKRAEFIYGIAGST